MQRISRDDALFLDFDGTLADLVDRPDGVVIAAGLLDTLATLRTLLGGALAIVSGRSIAQIDGYLAPLELPAAGVHGAERRRHDGLMRHDAHTISDSIVATLQEFTRGHAGLLVETKPGAVALHFRMAPHLEALCIGVMERAAFSAPGCVVMVGKMVAELKPASSDKGTAIDAFLGEIPFIGRRPVFAGDDTTDEAGFAVVQARGGIAIKVGAGLSIAEHHIESPTALRRWLRQMADELSAEGIAAATVFANDESGSSRS